MRSSLTLTLSLLLAAAPLLRGADLAFVRVSTDWRAADSFERISEYFDGRENTGGQTILRSQPKAREGFYVQMRTATKAAIPGARVEFQVYLPGQEQPKVFTSATDLPAGSHVTLAGLTGADWPGEKIKPAAWHVAVLGPDGAILASAQSFLWSPPRPPPTK
jgi:hypothetical protein